MATEENSNTAARPTVTPVNGFRISMFLLQLRLPPSTRHLNLIEQPAANHDFRFGFRAESTGISLLISKTREIKRPYRQPSVVEKISSGALRTGPPSVCGRTRCEYFRD